MTESETTDLLAAITDAGYTHAQGLEGYLQINDSNADLVFSGSPSGARAWFKALGAPSPEQLCAAALGLSGLVVAAPNGITAEQLMAAGFAWSEPASMWEIPTGDAAEDIPFGVRLTWSLLAEQRSA